MEPSSTQNLSDKDNSSIAQKASRNEITSENSTAQNSAETAGNNSSPDDTDTNVISTKESHFDTSNEEGSTVNLETEKVTKSVAEEFTGNIQNRRVIMTYETRDRPRQPFFNSNTGQNQRPPPPPNYYSAINRPQTTPTVIQTRKQEQHHQFLEMREISLFPELNINTANWAQYPATIPPDVPPCLAHLVDAEVLFIIQKIDIVQLLTGFSDLNMFLIQNKNGEYVYYAYETTDFCGHLCFKTCRNFQLHLVDLYQNEVIYMNKPCGCTNFFCCYPVIEVYAPPMIPVGAVMKVFNFWREEYVIVDPDENEMFRILGHFNCKSCCKMYEFTFSIHALDSQKTVVGYIRRDFGGFFRLFFTDADLYGISFPKNMDVRIKAVFLGALFLIDVMYFD